MVITLDLFRENASTAIQAEGMSQTGFTFPCFTPWQKNNLSNSAEEEMFSAYLTKLLFFLKNEYREEFRQAIFIVPFDFSFLQRAKIRKIAMEKGIKNVHCGYSTEYQAFFHIKNERRFFYAQLEKDRIEYGVIEMIDDDVVQTLGIGGIRLNNSDRSEQARARLNADVKQFLKSIKEENGEEDGNLYVFGNTFDSAVKWLEQSFNKTAVTMHNDAVKGALRHALIREGSEPGVLLLQTVPFNISLALGENGERGIVVPRFTVYPCKRSIRLLVSTETMLHIYEGNYSNPKFDTKIGCVSLAEIPEGHEVECIVEVDGIGIVLTVCNDKGKIVFSKSLHELS